MGANWRLEYVGRVVRGLRARIVVVEDDGDRRAWAAEHGGLRRIYVSAGAMGTEQEHALILAACGQLGDWDADPERPPVT